MTKRSIYSAFWK